MPKEQGKPKRIRVTHVSKGFPPDIGGAEHHVYYVTRNLAKLGINCNILALTSSTKLPTYPKSSPLLIRRVGQYVTGPPTFWKVLRYYKCFIQWTLEILRFSKESDILHIHAPSPRFRVPLRHNLKPSFLLKKFGLQNKPTIVTFHGLHTRYHTQYLSLDHMDVESGDFFIGVDKSICHDLQNYFGIASDRIFHIPNGVDTELFFPLKADLALKRRLFRNPSLRIILLPRRVDPKNGILQAVRAFSEIVEDYRNVRLLILGFGSRLLFTEYQMQILNEIKRLGLGNYVIPHRTVPYRLMQKFYGISYLSLVPSLWEATSLSALESLACGVPVVASNTGGLPEVITNEVGMLHRPGNVHEMIKDITYLLENPQIRESMSKKAIMMSKKRDWKANAKKVLNVYERVLNLN